MTTIHNNRSLNEWSDFWYNDIGVNVIPANTKEKQTYDNWSQWQEQSIPIEIHESRKRVGYYDKGIAIIPGRIWRGFYKDKYLVAIDLDNKKAIEEFCRNGLEELKQQTLIEQTSNPDKMHIYFIIDREISNKSSDKVDIIKYEKIQANEIPALEVKSNGKGIMFCSYSPHKNGSNYQIKGTLKPRVFNAQDIENTIRGICDKYGISYGLNSSNNNNNNNQIPIKDLFKPETMILEGHNRHEGLLRITESLLQRNKTILSLDKIRKLAHDWNQEHCIPPLDEREFEKQWKDALNFVSRKENEQQEDRQEEANQEQEANQEGTLSEAESLIAFVSNNIGLLFKDQFGNLFVHVRIGKDGEDDIYEIMSLSSKKFEKYILKLCYESEYEFIPSKEVRNNVIDYFQTKAEFSGNFKKLELRVAKTDDFTFYYDLTNPNGNAVKITSHGWSIIKIPPILFRRYSHQLPQVTPFFLTIDDRDDKIFDKFITHLNIKDDDNKLLLKCYIISLFIPEIAKPILMLHGEQGSAKSTIQELIRMMVDPSSILTLTFPRDINELIQKLSHHYIAYFDNISSIKEWISDQLCRGVTGSGFSKRQLYTDDDDVIYNFKRCIGFNSINLGATKADLLDRGIIIQSERILKENRRKIEDIWNDFEILRPQLLAYIFDIIAKVLQVKQRGGIKIPGGLNRMADFEEYAEIISRCMGYPEGEFVRVYQENINTQIDEAIEASPLSMAVLGLIGQLGEEKPADEVKEWSGTATELSERLNEIAESELKINIQKIRSWPKSPNSLSRRLNEIKTNLREKGIKIVKIKDSKGNRLIRICKISSIPSNRQEPENQAQNGKNTLDGILCNEKISSKISSNENSENQAQNNDSGRYGDIDDDLHKIREHLAKGKTLKCHHKGCEDIEYHSLETYNKHCFNRHPKQPMYPDFSLIETMGLNPQGNPWEY